MILTGVSQVILQTRRQTPAPYPSTRQPYVILYSKPWTELIHPVFHIRRLRPWRRPLQPQESRQHLQPHWQSYCRRLREADCRTRGWNWCFSHRVGPGCPVHSHYCARACRRQHHLDVASVWRHVQPVQGHAAAHGHSHEVCGRR
jgi:hypothetical protein